MFLQFVAFFGCPESPKFYIVFRGDKDEAQRVLQKLRHTADVREEMETYRQEIGILKVR
jgi:hypothetical protein